MSKSRAPAPEGQLPFTTKIRIVGVDTGSSKYNAVLDQYRGLIGQFLRSQHQQLEISGQRYYKTSIEWDGARATYQNNNGQDTLWISVGTGVGEGEEVTKMGEYFRCALVELDIPGLATRETDFDIFAQLVSSGDPVWAHQNQSSDNKTLQFAEVKSGAQIANVAAGDFGRASLLVDLTAFQAPIGIDLYALIDANTVQNPDPGPITTPIGATLSAALFDDKLFDCAVSYDAQPGNYPSGYWWEDSRIYPQRHKLGVAPDPVIVTAGVFPYPGGVGANVGNQFGLPKIGTVKLSPSKAQAGFKFDPA